MLRNLDEYEFAKLEEMVVSPYFNKDKKCTLLLQLVKPFHPEYDDEKLTREWLFFKLFPQKKKLTSSLNTTMTKLQSLAEEHLIRQKLNDRFLYKNHLLLDSFLDKGLNKQFQTHYKETMNRYSNMKRKDSMNFFEQYLIEKDYYLFNKSEKGRNRSITTASFSNHLDDYYLIQKLTFACEQENQVNISTNESTTAEELIEFAIDKKEDNLEISNSVPRSHMSMLLRRMLVCLKQPNNEASFEEYFTLFLNTDSTTVNRDEYNEFFVHTINYCIYKIIEGKGEYRKKLFELYKMIVEFGLIYVNGFLNLNRVKNIISCAAQVGELEWAASFLDEYKGSIHPDQYNSAYHFYRATIYFYQQQFEDAIEYLNKIESDLDKYYFLNRTTLLLRCYYEAKEPLAFNNTCKTFRANLGRNKKLTTKEKRIYGTFARLAYFVHQYRDGFSKKSKAKLEEMVMNAKFISHRQWLQEKLDKLR